MDKEVNKLPEKVAKKYECIRVPGRHLVQRPKRKLIDLRTITVAEADELVKHGFPYLVLKDKSKNSTPASNEK